MITYIGPNQRNNFKKAVKTKLNKVKNIYLALFFIIPSTFLVFDYSIIDAHEYITGDKKATCMMLTDDGGLCTAFLVSDNGLLLTARHCVEDLDDNELVTLNFDKIKQEGYSNLKARVIHLGATEDDDYAILQLVDPKINIQPLQISEKPADPELYTPAGVTVIGYPVTQVLGKRSQSYDQKQQVRNYLFESDTTLFIINEIFTGNSGGPVIDQETGKVIGIVSKKYTDETADILAERFGMSFDGSGLSFAEKIHQVFEDPKASHINW